MFSSYTGRRALVAQDPASGTPRWEFDPHIDRRGDRPFRCRGVSYAEEVRAGADSSCSHRLYLGTHDRALWAIDALTGAQRPGDNLYAFALPH